MVTRISCHPRPFPCFFPSLSFALSLCAAAAFNVAQQKVERACLTRSFYSTPGDFGPHLLLPFPSLFPFVAHYQLHYVALAARHTAGHPAQPSSVPAASCNNFMCQKLHAIHLWSLTHTHVQHTHTHICITPTHTHTRTCEKQHSTHLISIIYDA